MKLSPLENIISRGIIALVFLLPLFFLPLTPNFYFFNKLILLLVGASALLLLSLVKQFFSKGFRGSLNGVDVAVLIFLAVNLLSTFLNPHPAEAFYGGTGMILGVTLFYFLVVLNQPKTESVQKALLFSASLLGVIGFYQSTGLTKALAFWEWMQPKEWTPAGSLVALATFFVVVLPLAVNLFKKGQAVETSDVLKQALYFLPFVLIGTGVVVTFLHFVRTPPALLPWLANWQISVEGFKNIRTLFLGVGPENFIFAFTRAKPLYLNQTPVWNAIFVHGRSEYLHLLTTTGLLGLVSFAWLALQFLKGSFSLRGFPLSFLLALLVFVFLPGNLLTWLVVYLALAFKEEGAKSFREEMGASFAETGAGFAERVKLSKEKVLFTLPSIFASLLLLVIIYASLRVWKAEYYTYQSMLAAAENKGRETYLLQQGAISLNPYLDRYHLNFANTCFLLANSLAARTDLTDQERQMILPLIQQAINEASRGTALAGYKSENWQFRGNLYRSLINLAQGADQWTIASYQQAIRLDPANPILRVNYGGLFYLYRNYNMAIQQFGIAVQIKPDYANGWYNLAAAYRDNGQFVNAAQAMQQVLNFLPADSPDRPRAESELEELKQKVTEVLEAQPQPSEPQESLGLPETPPATPSGVRPIVLPSPSPKPSPEPSPSPEAESPWE